MYQFDTIKNSYISAVQWGLALKVGYNESKHGNEIIHKFCENFIDNSNYNEHDKPIMKAELEIIKEALSQEIESFYQKGESE